MPHTQKSAGRLSKGKSRRAPSDESDVADAVQNETFDSEYMDEDNDLERADAAYRRSMGMRPRPDVVAANLKRKRILSAKAKAALEQGDLSSSGSVEARPEPKKKTKLSKTHGKQGEADQTTAATELTFRPADVHPASLVRRKSPSAFNQTELPPPRIQRKYRSYSEAVSGGSASSAEEADEAGAAGTDQGSLADFIDDRAEDELSVDSAVSIEEPRLRKSKASKKRSTRQIVSSKLDRSRKSKQGGTKRVDTRGATLSEAIVIEDDTESEPQQRPISRKRVLTRTSTVKFEDSGSELEVITSPSKPRSRNANTVNSSRRKEVSGSAEQLGQPSKVATGSGRSTKSNSKGQKPAPPPFIRDSPEPALTSRRQKEKVDTAIKDEPDDPEIPIEWPSTPEPPSKDRPRNAQDAKKPKVEDEDALNPDVELLPGQDPLLADTYSSLEPLKPVELFPLFSSQDPPEDEALKLSGLLRPYKSTPAAAHLLTRLKALAVFQQNGVLINPARAKLSKVNVSSYGTSNYFVIPTTVVQPRNGALPFAACFLMTGVCAYCNLYQAAQKTLGERRIVDHRIGLYPIEFEYQRALRFLATAAKKSSIRYSFTSGILAFTTKTESSSDSNSANFGASPKKSAFHKDRAAPPAQSSLANPVLEFLRTSKFPGALSFADEIPILDARGSNFLTGPFDLSQLHTLPVINVDIEESSVVTVGFTSNTYVGTGSLAGADVLSFNVQFVILHASPPS